jgi:hypothetical protein
MLPTCCAVVDYGMGRVSQKRSILNLKDSPNFENTANWSADPDTPVDNSTKTWTQLISVSGRVQAMCLCVHKRVMTSIKLVATYDYN